MDECCEVPTQLCQYPTELIIYILKLLPVESLISCRQICKRWRGILDDKTFDKLLWQKFCKRDFKSTYESARVKAISCPLFFHIYRSLSLWERLEYAAEVQAEFALFDPTAGVGKVESIQILENNEMAVLKFVGVDYYNTSTLEFSGREMTKGDFVKYIETKDVTIVHNGYLELVLTKKRNQQVAEGQVAEDQVVEDQFAEDQVAEGQVAEGQVAEGQVAEGQVAEGQVAEGQVAEGQVAELQPATFPYAKLIFLLGRLVYVADCFDNIFYVNLDVNTNEQFTASVEVPPPYKEIIISLSLYNGDLHVITRLGNIYKFKDNEFTKVLRMKSRSTNIFSCLHKYGFIENMIWSVFYDWVSTHRISIPNELRNISRIKMYGDTVFIGTNTGDVLIYYKPFTYGQLNFHDYKPVKVYHFGDGLPKHDLSSDAIMGIDVAEMQNGHRLFIAMEKKIISITYTHPFGVV